MAKTTSRKRVKPKDGGRKGKKKVSLLSPEQTEYLDYKDVDLLRRYMSDRAKIKARRVNGNTPQQQRLVANAVKNAREMALLPYSSRVTTQRRGGSGGGRRDGGGGRDGGGSRGPREDRPPRSQDDTPSEAVEAPETTPVVEDGGEA